MNWKPCEIKPNPVVISTPMESVIAIRKVTRIVNDQLENPDNWVSPQKILIVLAHPDDPEFFCGASVARWTSAGHQVIYCLLTCGDKGTKDRSIESGQLCCIRQVEQRKAAAMLGVNQVQFLSYEDGYLVADLTLRRDITRVIRQIRPDILVTCDPTTLFYNNQSINHPDHRAAGQAALDSVFPAARDHLNFVELWRDENLEPHFVREVWVCGTLEPSVVLNVSEYWETKIHALFEHKSQIGDPEKLAQRMRNRRTADSTPDAPQYEEKFRRIILA
jgi:LmbE family N-acetylglucosaminyl deacetylase